MIGEKIKAARQRVGMTQKELGDKLGIPYQSIGQWERNLRKPKRETIEKIADALGVKTIELVSDFDWSMLSTERVLAELVLEGEENLQNPELAKAYDKLKKDLNMVVVKGFDETKSVPTYDLYFEGYSIDEKTLLQEFNKLNDDGKFEALKQIEELTKSPKYQRETAPEAPESPFSASGDKVTTKNKKPPENPQGATDGE